VSGVAVGITYVNQEKGNDHKFLKESSADLAELAGKHPNEVKGLLGVPDSEDALDIPSNIRSYFEAEPRTREYIHNFDPDSVSGDSGKLDFGDLKLPRYVSDYENFGRQKIQHPDNYLMRGSGDCDDYAVFTETVMAEIDEIADSKVVWGTMRTAKKWIFHFVTEFEKDGETYVTGTEQLEHDRPGDYIVKEEYVPWVASEWRPLAEFGKYETFQPYEASLAESPVPHVRETRFVGGDAGGDSRGHGEVVP